MRRLTSLKGSPALRVPWAVGLAIVLALATPGRVSAATCTEDHPNIILIVADDLGWTDLPFFNQPLDLTPTSGTQPRTPSKIEVRQNPTVNRLDARLFAQQSSGALGDTTGYDEFGAGYDVIPADGTTTHVYKDDEHCGTPPCAVPSPRNDVIKGFGGLQRLARHVRFTRFYAASALCLPTRAAIVTGRHGSRTGATSNEPRSLPPDEVTIAEHLKQHVVVGSDGRYTTGIFGKWHVGGLKEDPDSKKPWNEGFDEAIIFDGADAGYFNTEALQCSPALANNSYLTCEDAQDRNCCESAANVPSHFRMRTEFSAGEEARSYCSGKSVGQPDDDCPFHIRVYGELAQRFIREHRDDSTPFFLMLTVNAVHQAQVAPQRTNAHYGKNTGNGVARTQRTAAYWALIEELDAAIGRILDTIDNETPGIANKTIVMFTSDQGQEGHKNYGRPNLRRGKFSVFEGGIRIPFLARACTSAATTTSPTISSEPFGQVDLFRTVADAAGVPAVDEVTPVAPDDANSEKSYHLDGKSFYALLQGPSPTTQKKFAFARLGNTIATIMRPKEKGVCGKLNTDHTSCTPCDSNADCASVPWCTRVGKRCTGTSIPCLRNAECTTGTCDKVATVPNLVAADCNQCVEASWKLKSTPENALLQPPGGRGGLFELETNPEEHPDADCWDKTTNNSALVTLRTDIDRRLQFWHRCAECDCEFDCENDTIPTNFSPTWSCSILGGQVGASCPGPGS